MNYVGPPRRRGACRLPIILSRIRAGGQWLLETIPQAQPVPSAGVARRIQRCLAEAMPMDKPDFGQMTSGQRQAYDQARLTRRFG